MEQAGRALASLTRTLRELNGLLAQHQLSAADGWDDDMPEDIDEFRLELARRIEAFVQSRMGEEDAGAAPADAGAAAPASDAQAASGPESASAPKSVSAPSP
jgi:hypothetical protein